MSPQYMGAAHVPHEICLPQPSSTVPHVVSPHPVGTQQLSSASHLPDEHSDPSMHSTQVLVTVSQWESPVVVHWESSRQATHVFVATLQCSSPHWASDVHSTQSPETVQAEAPGMPSQSESLTQSGHSVALGLAARRAARPVVQAVTHAEAALAAPSQQAPEGPYAVRLPGSSAGSTAAMQVRYRAHTGAWLTVAPASAKLGAASTWGGR
jgi:hypothetical protein